MVINTLKRIDKLVWECVSHVDRFIKQVRSFSSLTLNGLFLYHVENRHPYTKGTIYAISSKSFFQGLDTRYKKATKDFWQFCFVDSIQISNLNFVQNMVCILPTKLSAVFNFALKLICCNCNNNNPKVYGVPGKKLTNPVSISKERLVLI